MGSQASYLFLEIALVISIFVFTADSDPFHALRTRTFLLRSALLFALWFAVDQIAISLGIWYFPPQGTLPMRIARLPLEEYALFFFHSVICQMLVASSLKARR
jgi:lycopene cyclase domain-containing protein